MRRKKNCSFPFFERLHSSKICKCNSKTAWIFFWTQGCSADVTIKSNVAQAAHLIESFFTHQETYKSSSQFETLCKKVIGYILCNNDKDATIFCPSRKSTRSNNETFWFSCHMFYIDPLTNRCCQFLIQQENKEIEAALLFDSYIDLEMTLLKSLTLLQGVPTSSKWEVLVKISNLCQVRILKKNFKNIRQIEVRFCIA